MTRAALPEDEADLTAAFAASALAVDSPVTPNDTFDTWFAERRHRNGFTVRRVPFRELSGWRFAPGTGDLRHDSGHFFAVEGLRVRTGREPGATWDQPVMSQREIGVLGFLTAAFDGIPHFLVQAKMEPGNVNTVHLAPTVQATRSNLTGVHRGRGTHHAEHFAAPRGGRVLVDSLQSERGSWFLRKRNRHMVVEAAGEVAEHEDFRWLTLGQLRRLLSRNNLVTMEACSVLSCLPPLRIPESRARDAYGAALLRSLSPAARTVHGIHEVISGITELKARYQVGQQTIGLNEVGGWEAGEDALRRPDGRYFEIIGTEVWAHNREVAHWTQPLLTPAPGGVSALVTKVIDGVLHLLLHARTEAGLIDVAELCPTVQCTPSNYRDVPPGERPRYLDDVLAAPPGRIRYDTVISEEGARFYRAENRYLVIEAGEEFDTRVPDDFIWVSLAQVSQLLRHSYYLNMQARTLISALHAVW
ncbi:NDP-hexose 2,3-dehydratase family protein [Streptomyces rimosus]|uniref:NDP-hexose 2,3-dehydratase family protein n=1 Tax=Streptomyces rimosus TaxID=1927 RepID=UPI0004C4814F|nr:NDP-hexose 2,3-dehydratase family protein [Streptomyces rimosus]